MTEDRILILGRNFSERVRREGEEDVHTLPDQPMERRDGVVVDGRGFNERVRRVGDNDMHSLPDQPMVKGVPILVESNISINGALRRHVRVVRPTSL